MFANESLRKNSLHHLYIRIPDWEKIHLRHSQRFYFSFCAVWWSGLWAFGGLRERSLSPSDKVNAGAKLPECTSASLWT